MTSLVKYADVYFAPFTASNTHAHLQRLIKEIDWQYLTSNSRGVYQMGFDYAYSGVRVKGQPFDKAILFLMKRINREFGFNLNSCLLNYYKDGSVAIAEHSDNERSLAGGDMAVVVSVSLGAERNFKLRAKDGTEKVNLVLHDGSILVMGAGTQRHYVHSVPKQMKVKEPRVNLTFRQFMF